MRTTYCAEWSIKFRTVRGRWHCRVVQSASTILWVVKFTRLNEGCTLQVLKGHKVDLSDPLSSLQCRRPLRHHETNGVGLAPGSYIWDEKQTSYISPSDFNASPPHEIVNPQMWGRITQNLQQDLHHANFRIMSQAEMGDDLPSLQAFDMQWPQHRYSP